MVSPKRLATIFFCAALSINIVCAEWVYPDLIADEGPMFKTSVLLNQIKSDKVDASSYTLSGEGSDKFEIDNAGRIYQTKELDREIKDRYTLMAGVYDKSGTKIEDDLEITIIVRDINDNYPIFDKDTLSGTVAEGATISDGPFLTISATDADDPNSFNSQVVFELVEGSDSPKVDGGPRFSVSPDGQVSVTGNLDYETDPVVTFQVVASDGGGRIPGLETTASVTITLTDSNDHAPVFDSSSLPATKYFSELTGLNTTMYNIHANDVDVGINKKVYCDITSGNTGGTFHINSFPSETGRSLCALELQKPLDFESGITEYRLTIRGFNKDALNAVDSKYHVTSELVIKVTDENEPPVFINTPYLGIVSEDEDEPAEPVPIGVVVAANDYDFNRNQTVEFSMNDPEGWFQVHSETGQISRVAKVDREAGAVVNGVYTVKVVATDNYDNGKRASGNADVTITIQDINDNPPRPNWGSNNSTVRICSRPDDDTVRRIVASDPDSDINGAPFIYRLGSEVDTSKWGVRTINAEESEIYTKFEEYRIRADSEEVVIPFTISDSGAPPQTGTATLTVSICHCNDDGVLSCESAVKAGIHVIIIAIIAVLILIIILIFAIITYRRRQRYRDLEKIICDDSEESLGQTVQLFQEEGGEEDNVTYDPSVLRKPSKTVNPPEPQPSCPPIADDTKPKRALSFPGRADDESDMPASDCFLVFNDEGEGSLAGSLSSISTTSSDSSVDYDYLNNWGPRFKRLVDLYNTGYDST